MAGSNGGVATSALPVSLSPIEFVGNELLSSGLYRTVKTPASAVANLLAARGVRVVAATLDQLNNVIGLGYPAFTGAEVYADPSAASNGVYQKQGVSGTGSWLKIADLPAGGGGGSGDVTLDQLQEELEAEITRAETAEAALALVNTNQDTEIGSLTEGLAAEVDAREAGDTASGTALTTAINAEAAARVNGDAASNTYTNESIANLQKLLLSLTIGNTFELGASPLLYTNIESGDPTTISNIDATLCVPSATYGLVYRVRGAASIYTKEAYPVITGRSLIANWAFARFADPTDPAGDTIRAGIAWLDAGFQLVSEFLVVDSASINVAAGIQRHTYNVPSKSGDALSIVAPSGTKYFRLFLRSFGLDGVTDFAQINAVDISDAVAFAPDLTALQTALTDLQAEVAALHPLAAGSANGLATLDANGQLAQLPMSRAKVLLAMQQEFVTIAQASYSDFASTISDQHTPGSDYFAFYVDRDAPRAGALYNLIVAYLQLAYPGPGLSSADANAAAAAIWDAAATGGVAPTDTTPVTGDAELNDQRFHAAFDAYILGLPPARGECLYQTRVAFNTLSNTSYADLLASVPNAESGDEKFYAFHEYRDAPTNGVLYTFVKNYLIATGMSGSAAATATMAIWQAAAIQSYPPGA